MSPVRAERLDPQRLRHYCGWRIFDLRELHLRTGAHPCRLRARHRCLRTGRGRASCCRCGLARGRIPGVSGGARGVGPGRSRSSPGAGGAATTSSPAMSSPSTSSPTMSSTPPAESNTMNQSKSASSRARISAGVEEETLDTCLAHIPKDATVGQRMLAEQTCRRDFSRP